MIIFYGLLAFMAFIGALSAGSEHEWIAAAGCVVLMAAFLWRMEGARR